MLPALSVLVVNPSESSESTSVQIRFGRKISCAWSINLKYVVMWSCLFVSSQDPGAVEHPEKMDRT
jgi:hypothetical protein